MEERIKRELTESMLVKKNILERNVSDIMKFAELVIQAYKKNHRLIAFGNGGSAADAQHIVAELVNYQYLKERPMLDALALSVNTSVITAIGNDIGFENLFAKQIESLAKPGDVILGITTSGNSENIIKGLKKAKENGAKCVALTGKDGGKLNELDLDLVIKVQSEDTARIQEGHITIGHIMCSLVEKELFQEKKLKIISEETPSITATAPVRISFANGGDTDDYIKKIGTGYVLNATLKSHYYKCSLIPKQSNTINVNANNTHEGETWNYEIKNFELKGDNTDLIKATLKRIKPDFKGEIIMETNVPSKSGMGGSSSFTVALIEALYKLDNKQYTAEQVARLAYNIERHDLRNEGGYQDQWAAAYKKGINFMEFTVKGPKVNNLKIEEQTIKKLENNLILFHLEQRESSGNEVHVDQVKQVQQDPEKIKKILIEKNQNVLATKDTLLTNNLEQFGKLIGKDTELKKQLSSKITTPYIEDIYNTAMQNGAIGGRISGAGSGGSVFFYCQEQNKQNIIDALKQKGAIHIPIEFQKN